MKAEKIQFKKCGWLPPFN